VLANILAQRIGPGTVADLRLPPGLLARITDRIIRSSFEDRSRGVFADAPLPLAPAPGPIAAGPDAGSESSAAVEIIDVEAEGEDRRSNWPEGRPALRGFFPAVIPDPARPDLAPDWRPSDPAELEAASFVARRLATDGLLAVTAGLLREFGEVVRGEQGRPSLERLERVGLPWDLLAFFSAQPGDDAPDGASVRERAERTLEALARPSGDGDVRELTFRFPRTAAGFVPTSDAGEDQPGLIRMQMTRGGHWAGPGSGDNLDLIRGVCEALPDVDVVVSIHRDHAAEFAAHARGWRRGTGAKIVVLRQSATVSQWAQDNAKGGRITAGDDLGRSTPAVLAPRYPSRGDDGSVFVPGESAILGGLRSAGVHVVQSPLLFQGGNLLITPHPGRAGEKLLLIGEADVARNTALGLSHEQAVEALRIEFGADAAAVMPTVSYHLDYDVTIRVGAGGDVAAFVNDGERGTRMVLEAAVDRLEAARLLPKPRLKAVRQHLRAGKWAEVVQILGGGVFGPAADAAGNIPASLARVFADGAWDNGAANTRRVLCALDGASAWERMPWEGAQPAHARAYARSVRRRELDGRELASKLRELGFRVVGVAGIASEDRGVSFLNGVQLAGVMLMPSYRPMFAGVSEEAAATVKRESGCGTAGIAASESGCRNGVVRCSVSVLGRG